MIKRQTKDKLIVDGRIELKEVETLIGEKFPKGAYETVAGIIIYTLGRMPKKGEEIIIGNVRFKVLRTNIRRVQEVLVEKIEKVS